LFVASTARMHELPIVPDPVPRAGFELERQRRRFVVARLRRPESVRRAVRRLVRAFAMETLCLTGTPLVLDEAVGAKLGDPPSRNLLEAQMAALDAVRRSIIQGATLGRSLILEVHRLACPPDGGAFRTGPGRIQFASAVPSPPGLIAERIDGLADWLATEGVQEMTVPEKAALAFMRVVEIAPFERGNFRVAHLMLDYFAASEGYPPFYFRREEATGLREDIERALRFDTEPLVSRLLEALLRSLQSCLHEAGVDTPAGER
jgi:hypothetical protein